jgi:predicted transcriptional regulator
MSYKKQQARELYMQSGLTKTQIADLLGISRRSVHYWVKEGDWDRLKRAGNELPALMAEKCYHIINHLTDSYCSEHRITNPVSYKEVDALHKLVITIGKLKGRASLNESVEIFGYFIDGLRRQAPHLADELGPYIDKYLAERAGLYPKHIQPANFGELGRIPWSPDQDDTETQLDRRDLFDWDNERMDAEEALRRKHTTQPEIPFPTDEPPLDF